MQQAFPHEKRLTRIGQNLQNLNMSMSMPQKNRAVSSIQRRTENLEARIASEAEAIQKKAKHIKQEIARAEQYFSQLGEASLAKARKLKKVLEEQGELQINCHRSMELKLTKQIETKFNDLLKESDNDDERSEADLAPMQSLVAKLMSRLNSMLEQEEVSRRMGDKRLEGCVLEVVNELNSRLEELRVARINEGKSLAAQSVSTGERLRFRMDQERDRREETERELLNVLEAAVQKFRGQ